MVSRAAFETGFALHSPGVDALSSPDSSDNENTQPTPARRTVLLVDDDEFILSLLSLALQKEGFEVLPASDGTAALKLVTEHLGKIDMLISDIVMPEMSGIELARTVKRVVPGMKVLLMSGYFDPDQMRDEMPAGTAYLQKPFGPADVMQRINELLAA